MMQYPIPVVRLIVRDAEGRVLLLKRKGSEYACGLWCLPGGKVGYGERVERAAVRELEEETSLICTSPRFLFYQDSPPLEPGKMHCINLYFECAASGDVVLDEESSQFRWIGPAHLPKYEIAFRNDEGLIRYW